MTTRRAAPRQKARGTPAWDGPSLGDATENEINKNEHTLEFLLSVGRVFRNRVRAEQHLELVELCVRLLGMEEVELARDPFGDPLLHALLPGHTETEYFESRILINPKKLNI